ncbi:helicase-associated domain-containing protein [Gulosibacter molinativorax]|uniref:Helicase XPB/Ssl2 N-terminal domain-containing protein n=1 Tax=Gulosibacter molinativorax TaxID=256821 RepID=A0ABT7CA06_9MICO|nr:helicase-associated domain-containing protein [Gulosibacter molinativorax]MDJ1372051.1 hypothetical protein [Gulosibacter molinativorax]QUY63900.1 Hypotetical protein [Gulosibacter molinativorax]
MSTVPDSLRILSSLRKLDEPGFARLIQDRKVNSRAVEDLLDLAEWLEAPANIASALGRLDWPTLRGLRLGNEDALDRAAELELAVGEDDALELLPEVVRQLATLVPTVTKYRELDRSQPESAGTASAHEVTQLANDALWLIAVEPRIVRRTRDQARMSGVEVRRLATQLGADSTVVGSMYRWLHAADLITPVGAAWHLTEDGDAFSSLPVTDRWRRLIDAWLAELTLESLQTLTDSLDLVGSADRSTFIDDGEDTSALTLLGNAAAQVDSAAALGLVDRGEFTLLGALVLDDDRAEAADLLAQHLPEEVTQVYVQPDQTILSPGPLSGALDQKLRQVADLERRALASEYRVTPASLSRALNGGMTEESIRALLAEISLTGIPQPVDYLITSTAASHGKVRVQAYDRAASSSTRIRVEDAQLRDALEVDTAIGTLALRREGEDLVSRVAPAVVLAALLDARYPAVLEGASGALVSQRSRTIATPQRPQPGPTAAKTAAELAVQAASSDQHDDRGTWIQRRLEIARRNRAEVHVAIDVPGKDSVTLALVPLSVGPQRLRALDLDADVERTLPMRSILSIDD